MSKWITIAGLELLLFGVPAMINPAIYEDHLLLIVSIGVALVLIGLTFDHWPRAISFYNYVIWPDMEKSARFFRDYLNQQHNKTAVNQFDKQASEYSGIKGSSNNLLSGFHFWLVMGMDHGLLEVYGKPKNGAKVERILGKVENNTTGENFDMIREQPELLLMENGKIFEDIQIRRSTLKSFANWIGNADWSDYDKS